MSKSNQGEPRSLGDLGKQVAELARIATELSHLPEETESAFTPDDRPMDVWFDDSFVYVSIRCPEAAGSEADVFLGNGHAFVRVERTRGDCHPARPRKPSNLVLGPAI